MGEVFAGKPLPYNRFAGNPPAGVKAVDAFEAEMGFPYGWTPAVDAAVKEIEKNKSQSQEQASPEEVKK